MEVVGMGFVVVVVVGDSTWSGSILARRGGTCYMYVSRESIKLTRVDHCIERNLPSRKSLVTSFLPRCSTPPRPRQPQRLDVSHVSTDPLGSMTISIRHWRSVWVQLV